jgi:hypothetical protein
MFGHHGHHHGQNPPPAQAPAGGGGSEPTFKLFCKADEGYCLSVRDGNVVLAPTNPRDVNQHWFKDMRFSQKIKDEEGNPAFAIVNKATGLAVKHSLGQGHPVRRLAHFISPCFGPTIVSPFVFRPDLKFLGLVRSEMEEA